VQGISRSPNRGLPIEVSQNLRNKKTRVQIPPGHKVLRKILFAESNICNWVQGISRSPNRISAKIVFFDAKTDFAKKKFANNFAMSAAASPWGRGFESCFLGKSEFCGLFRCVPQKSSFSTTPSWVNVTITNFGNFHIF
jgi:hypothetical protein